MCISYCWVPIYISQTFSFFPTCEMLEFLIKFWNKKNREKQVEIKETHYKSFLDLQNFPYRKAESYCDGQRQSLFMCMQMERTSREGQISLGYRPRKPNCPWHRVLWWEQFIHWALRFSNQIMRTRVWFSSHLSISDYQFKRNKWQ